MPDLLAGTKVLALDFPPTVGDTEGDLFSFDSTAFGVDADTGTYNDCGVVFTGPTSGRVLVHFAAALDNSSGTDYTAIAPVVRTGSTVGAGTSVVAAAFINSMYHYGTNDSHRGRSLLVEGLTNGTVYNVRLEHRVGGGTGSIQHRSVVVQAVA